MVKHVRMGRPKAKLEVSDQQRRQLDLIQQLNRAQMPDGDGANVEGVIQSYELAFRMQDAMPDLMDLSGEDQRTVAMYGADAGPTQTFGRQCLLARRFADRGAANIAVIVPGDVQFWKKLGFRLTTRVMQAYPLEEVLNA